MKKILAICTLVLLPTLSCASQIPDDIEKIYGVGLSQACAAIHKGTQVTTLIPVESFERGYPVTRYQLSAVSLDILRDPFFKKIFVTSDKFEEFDRFDTRKRAAKKVYKELYPQNTPIDLILSWFRPVKPKMVSHESIR